MTYWREFAVNWRYLVAASVGMSAGYFINNYLNNVFIPHLMKEFSWTSSQVALIGVSVFLSVLCQPIAGRLTDTFGVRRVALVGVIAAPTIYLAFSIMSGAFTVYFLLNMAQIVFVAATTGAVVYSRLVAQSYRAALGLALAIVTSSPPVAGAIIVPFLSEFIDNFGWRAGYAAMASYSLVIGLAAILLVPSKVDARPESEHPRAAKSAPAVYREIFANKAFVIIIAGMVLCNVSVMMQTTQLKVLFQSAGLDSRSASLLISLYASGVILGRIMCGLALDRLAPHIVASIVMGLPGLGLGILVLDRPDAALLSLSALLLGLSLGAEGDVAAYLAKRFFRLEDYSTVLGLVMGAIAFSGAAGSLILSGSLAVTGSFTHFLTISAIAALMGGYLFSMLREIPPVASDWQTVAAE